MDPNLGPDGLPLPRVSDLCLRLILLLAVVLQLGSWAILDGYQLADSIEYVERAVALVHGHEVLDNQSFRSFFFPALLAPVLWCIDVFNIQDVRPYFVLFRIFQMLLGLALVLVTARVGARVGGRKAGLAAAFFVAANPVFLQYTVSPVTDIAAALCVGLGINALISPRRGGLQAGLWLGVAILCAYKTIPIVGAAGLVQTLRAWRSPSERRRWLGTITGVLFMLASQVVLDRVTYGQWGFSIQRYFLANFAPIAAKPFFLMGMPDIGRSLYKLSFTADLGLAGTGGARVLGKFPPHWYISNLHQFYVGPLVLCLLIGLWQAWRKASWTTSFPLALSVLYVSVLSTKGAKDYRLWLPLLAVLTPLVGLGWSSIWGAAGTKLWRRILAIGCLLSALGLGIFQLQDRNTRNFAGYWEAMDWINVKAQERLAEDPSAPPIKVASAFHWAIFMREAPGVKVTKLPHQLDGWTHLTPAQKRNDLFMLLEQDWLILHEPVLRNPKHKELLHVVGNNFVAEAVLWDRSDYEDLGPILVMRRENATDRSQFSHSLFDVIRDRDVKEYSRAHGFGEPMRLTRPELGEEIWALGFEYQELPPHGHGWITYHYYNAGERPKADYKVIDRLTTYDERVSWQNNHQPAWGVHPTNTWEPGWIVRESWPLIACENPYAWREPFRPLGAAYRRGDLMPVSLWISFLTDYWRCLTCGEPVDSEACCPENDYIQKDGTITNAEYVVSGRLERSGWDDSASDESSDQAMDLLQGSKTWRESDDKLYLWGQFFMPVHASARAPDNGRPLPN